MTLRPSRRPWPRPIIGDFPALRRRHANRHRSSARVSFSSTFMSFDIYLFSSRFLWAHRSSNSSPLRPTRLLLSWDLPRIIGHPPRMQTLTSDSTPPRSLSCPKENGAERKGKNKMSYLNSVTLVGSLVLTQSNVKRKGTVRSSPCSRSLHSALGITPMMSGLGPHGANAGEEWCN